MKKCMILAILILLILIAQNVFAQEIIFSIDGLTISRSDDGRLFGSDGFEYELVESDFVEYDFDNSVRGCSPHNYSVGGQTYGTAQVCTDRINSSSFSVYVTLTYAKPGLISPKAFPCYVQNYTNAPLYDCRQYLAQPLNVTTTPTTYNLSGANGYSGAFKMSYYLRKGIK